MDNNTYKLFIDPLYIFCEPHRYKKPYFSPTPGKPPPRYTSPLSCLMISLLLISIEVVINIMWLLIEPPSTTHIVDQPGKRILVCHSVDDSFMAGLIYPFFLILCATLYAFKTRKCPGGFNESRFVKVDYSEISILRISTLR